MTLELGHVVYGISANTFVQKHTERRLAFPTPYSGMKRLVAGDQT